MSDDDGKLPNDEKIEAALRWAHCDFVWELEYGLDTEIGERGVRLSWWQKQRLAIAKIFLKNPEIILLDEPTSALDSFSEEHITKALDELFVGRTVVIIAHRLQTVKKADEIIVLEGGQVVEHWNHEELIKKWWLYNKMLELQSGF
jgi:ABC-type multidrug transport system fused ATPase/permease subunit